jgi:exodeoxyribonuclease V alpha subunit
VAKDTARQLGPTGWERFVENPYTLLHARSVNFREIDRIILKSGSLAEDSPLRVEAALGHAASMACRRRGDTWVSPQEVLHALRNEGRFFSAPVSTPAANEILRNQTRWDHLVPAPPGLSPRTIALDEARIASFLLSFNKLKAPPATIKPSILLQLTPEQRQALAVAVANPISILTGGPGTGKTKTLKAVLETVGVTRTHLCAPTGKAAQRIKEACDLAPHQVSTVHSLVHELRNGLDFDTLIIDETSMLDVETFARLANRLRPLNGFSPFRILLVGDPQQLPSIAPGRVLADMITCKLFPVTQLTKVLRQAEGGLLANNAARIRGGEMIFGEHGENSAFVNLKARSIEQQKKLLCRAFTDLLLDRVKVDGTPLDLRRDVLVLVPHYEGQMGCRNLNLMLREVLNPPTDGQMELSLRAGGPRFRCGDRVLIGKNDVGVGVVNGDLGILKSLDKWKSHGVCIIETDDMRVLEVPESVAKSLDLGYALTVHKSQGSEAAVVLAVFNEEVPDGLRERSLLYTAITRARERCILFSDEQTLEDCLRNDRSESRRSQLGQMLQRPA